MYVILSDTSLTLHTRKSDETYFLHNVCIYDCCCEKRALKVSELHNFVTIQDTDMFDTSF